MIATFGPGQEIEVLVVDDSAVVRQKLKSIIESDPRFHVTLAGDPYEAVTMLSRSIPRVIVLDVEMPRMDGLTFLRKLMRQHPLPVVLCTSIPDRALSALEMGALEVIPKPDWRDPAKMAAWAGEFLASLCDAAGVPRPVPRDDKATSADVILARRPYVPRGGPSEPVIVVGISTGGVQTMPVFLRGLPEDCPGIVIVQHMPADFLPTYVERMNNDPKIRVRVALSGNLEPIRPGRALVIPGDIHGVVRRTGPGYRVELVEGPLVNRFRPSVDVLFRSAAQTAGPHAAGIIMTGMLDDGARGLLEMRESGGMTVAQDEATSIVFGMPKEAIRRGAAKFVHPLDRIAPAIVAWLAGLDPGSRQ
jgi:two-component system, chemotaxis family, protein-glutamate methylesterase/glutaminase